jgi:hypothetical protein
LQGRPPSLQRLRGARCTDRPITKDRSAGKPPGAGDTTRALLRTDSKSFEHDRSGGWSGRAPDTRRSPDTGGCAHGGKGSKRDVD